MGRHLARALFAVTVLAACGGSAREPSTAPSPTAEAAAEDIRAVSATEREVSTAAWPKVVDALASATERARPEGGTGPMRVFGVRPDDVLGKIGLENGDRLEAIDDASLDSEASAKDAFAKMRTAKTSSLRIQRKGAPLTITLRAR